MEEDLLSFSTPEPAPGNPSFGMDEPWHDSDEGTLDLAVLENESRDLGFNIDGEVERNSTYVEHGRLVSKTSLNGVFLESLSGGVNDINLLSSNVSRFVHSGDMSFLPGKRLPQYRKFFLPIELMVKFYAQRVKTFVLGNVVTFCITYALMIWLMFVWSVMKGGRLFIDNDPLKLLISCYMFLKEALTTTVSLLTVYLMIRGLVAMEKMTNTKIGGSHSSQNSIEQRLETNSQWSFEAQFGHHQSVAGLLFTFLIAGRVDQLSKLDSEPLGFVHLTWLMHYSPEWNGLVNDILMNVRTLSSHWCDGQRTFPHHALDIKELTEGLVFELQEGRRDFTTFALCAIVSGLIPRNVDWKTFFSRTSFIRYLSGGSAYYAESMRLTRSCHEFDVNNIVHFYEKSLVLKLIPYGHINGFVIISGGFVPTGWLLES